tara:strand:+ start:294 stop:710 length:417 start_codon:yes stop_codon:yes gene_type:complete
MNDQSNIKYLTVEETAEALKNARVDGILNSSYLSDMSINDQKRVEEQFKMTFTDDRSAYHREYMANMKAKEERQEITDEEEERIIKAYSHNKEFLKFREQAMKEKAILEKLELDMSKIAKEKWGDDKKELPDVVVNFD